MKAFLAHDKSGLLYRQGGEWVPETEHALGFASTSDAEKFRAAEHIHDAHAITRLDPKLVAQFWSRVPGAYQLGE